MQFGSESNEPTCHTYKYVFKNDTDSLAKPTMNDTRCRIFSPTPHTFTLEYLEMCMEDNLSVKTM